MLTVNAFEWFGFVSKRTVTFVTCDIGVWSNVASL